MANEFEAIAAVLEEESRVLQALHDEWLGLTDPDARAQNRLKREAHVQRFQRVNELLAQRLV